MQGKIIKGIAGFYYVHPQNGDARLMPGGRIYACKAKGIFRKDQMKPLVGDNVEMCIRDRVFPAIVADADVACAFWT